MAIPINDAVVWAFVKDNFDRWELRGNELCVPSLWKTGHDDYLHTGINLAKNGVVHDFILGEGMSFVEYVKEVRDFDELDEAENYIIELMLRSLKNGNLKEIIERRVDSVTATEDVEAIKIILPAQRWRINLSDAPIFTRKRCVNYLKKRRIPQAMIDKFNLTFCEDGFYKDRIIIPYYDNDEVIWFQARHIGIGIPKYLNPSGVKKSQIIYNIDSLEEGGNAILTEGAFDAMMVDGLAIMGKELSDYQMKRILEKKPSSITLALDQDLPGLDGTIKAANKLVKNNFTNIFVVLYDGEKDFADMGEILARKTVKENSVPWNVASEVQVIMKQENLKKIEARKEKSSSSMRKELLDATNRLRKV